MSARPGLARLGRSRWTSIATAAVLCGLYAQGGPACLLGFAALVPWLRTLNGEVRLAPLLLNAWAMSVAYTAAAFYWFGSALGAYTQIGAPAGLALLLLAAPLFQPQILVFAVVRHVARQRLGGVLAALAGAAAWVAGEWALPRVLGDTFGHGLYPAPLLRQAAELGGATGLTFLLLLSNEALAAALARGQRGLRAAAPPLAATAALVLLLAGYGQLAQQPEPPGAAPVLRMGLVQSNITEYERRRREQGAAAVVREVLDTHFAMSYDAIERQHADAVLWSETVYPTPFGQPKSEAGAALDAEIRTIVDAAGVPFVFGTYDRDAEGEYNAAAFVQPGAGLVGMYRKTRLFPFTEYLPPALEGLRAWLPGAGNWRPGTGARIFALRLADRGAGAREIPVLPLICLDDTDPGLAIEGARLGAQVILTMSNDAWFSDFAKGAALHQAAAAFRSIETRLPQFRVTPSGHSAVIDARGNLLATTRMGEQTLVIGELPVRDPSPTLMVRWGDWVGRTAAVFLAGLTALTWLRRRSWAASGMATTALPTRVAVLPPATRAVAGLLRLFSRAGALGIAAAWLWGDSPLTANSLALVRTFAALCVIPELAAWLLLRASTASLVMRDGVMLLSRGTRQLTLPLLDIAAVEPWRCPLPGAGLSLRLRTGERWPQGLALADPWALAAALGLPVTPWHGRLAAWARARAGYAPGPGLIGHPALKFLLLPLLLAMPAFWLHQNIAYGSPLGEFYSFGLMAYLRGMALWWAAWMAGVAACAAALRLLIETTALVIALTHPTGAVAARRGLEPLGAGLLYLGLAAWLLARMLA